MFRGELDLLEMRLAHLEDAVHRHVIVEAGVTFSGRRKIFWFAEHRERFAAWADRIIYIAVAADDLPPGTDPPSAAPVSMPALAPKAWAREHAQREHAGRGLRGADPGDVVLIADVDELPAVEVLDGLRRYPPAGPLTLEMRNHVFAVDWLHPGPVRCTGVTTYRNLPKYLHQARSRDGLLVIPDAGWHFSWLGGPDAIEEKNADHAHQELAWKISQANKAGKLYEQGWCPWDDTWLKAVEVDETYPEYIASRKCPGSWFRPYGPGGHAAF
jgi:hypothetical protein